MKEIYDRIYKAFKNDWYIYIQDDIRGLWRDSTLSMHLSFDELIDILPIYEYKFRDDLSHVSFEGYYYEEETLKELVVKND